MGQSYSRYFLPHIWKEDTPDAYQPIKYDPQFGFDGQRSKVEIKARKEDMDSMGLREEFRDQCAHIRMAYYGCLDGLDIQWWKCNGLWNEITDCYATEQLRDMMEYEREKRLNQRERRLKRESMMSE